MNRVEYLGNKELSEESSLYLLKVKFHSKLTNMAIGRAHARRVRDTEYSFNMNDHYGNGGNKLGKRNVGSNLSSHRKG